MVYEYSPNVYCCCGQYIAPTASASKKTIKCPRCGKKQTKPVKYPMVVIVKN